MASAASHPPNHTLRMASKLSFSHVITVGRPEKLSSTMGLPSFFRAASMSRWASGMSRLLRLQHSPLISDDSPTAATMTSALRSTRRWPHRASPCRNVCRARDILHEPQAGIVHEVGASGIQHLCLAAHSLFHGSQQRFVLSEAGNQAPCARHVALAVANGPTRAMRPFFCKGSTLPLFFRRTNVSAATLRASARWAGVNISFWARFSLQ